jgi:predicted Rossmann fold flavoprotein
VPALAPLLLDGDFHAPLAGVAHEAEITVRAEGAKPLRVRGAVLWTHFGVSGPAAMNASRAVERARGEGRAVSVTLDFLPGEDAGEHLLAIAPERPAVRLHNALAALLPSRVAEAVLRSLGVESCPMARLPGETRRRLARALAAWSLPVRGSRGYGFAEATAGGVPLEEVNPATMESRKCPGLYLVGEILDVDGRIGGFNFQWAWSSGFAAGRALACAPR